MSLKSQSYGSFSPLTDRVCFFLSKFRYFESELWFLRILSCLLWNIRRFKRCLRDMPFRLIISIIFNFQWYQSTKRLRANSNYFESYIKFSDISSSSVTTTGSKCSEKCHADSERRKCANSKKSLINFSILCRISSRIKMHLKL